MNNNREDVITSVKAKMDCLRSIVNAFSLLHEYAIETGRTEIGLSHKDSQNILDLISEITIEEKEKLEALLPSESNDDGEAVDGEDNGGGDVFADEDAADNLIFL